MKRASLFCFAASGLLAVAAFAQQPAQKPANLPPGHPTVPAQNPNTLPPGHPSVPNQGQGQLPTGHPSVNGQAPTTRPAAKSAALIVRAFQGTKGGPAIGAEPVTVELWNQGKLLNKIEGKLDESGTSVFQNIPLDPPFQPQVKIAHGGVEFSAIGDIMDPYHAGQEIGLQLYETTDKQPDWALHMRHVIVEPTQDGIHVVEILAIENPADRAWLGTSQADGKRASISFQLSDGTEQVQASDESGQTSLKVVDGKLIDTRPLMPGVTQIQISYVIPLKNGDAKLAIVAPAPVKHMMLLVTDNGAKVQAEGLEAGGSHDMGNGKTLVFGGNDLKPGHKAILTVTPVKIAPKAAVGAHTDAGASSKTAQYIAAAGGGVALVVGTMYVLLKPTKVERA